MDIAKARMFKKVVEWVANKYPKTAYANCILRALNSGSVRKFKLLEFPKNPELTDIAKTKRYIEDSKALEVVGKYAYIDLEEEPYISGEELTLHNKTIKVPVVDTYKVRSVFIDVRGDRLKFTLFVANKDLLYNFTPDRVPHHLCTYTIEPNELLLVPGRLVNECLHRIVVCDSYTTDKNITYVAAPDTHLPFSITGKEPHSVNGHWRLLPPREYYGNLPKIRYGHKPDGSKVEGMTWVRGFDRYAGKHKAKTKDNF